MFWREKVDFLRDYFFISIASYFWLLNDYLCLFQYGPELRASEHLTSKMQGSSTDSESISAQDIEKLQDMVVAYEMQNKFLNKEVLELNQLRQQAIDREQKLFM